MKFPHIQERIIALDLDKEHTIVLNEVGLFGLWCLWSLLLCSIISLIWLLFVLNIRDFSKFSKLEVLMLRNPDFSVRWCLWMLIISSGLLWSSLRAILGTFYILETCDGQGNCYVMITLFSTLMGLWRLRWMSSSLIIPIVTLFLISRLRWV